VGSTGYSNGGFATFTPGDWFQLRVNLTSPSWNPILGNSRSQVATDLLLRLHRAPPFQGAGPRASGEPSSVAGTKVRATIDAYAATKHAIEALAHSLRLELAETRGRISNIQPGLVSTEIFEHMPEDARPGRQQAIPEPLTPEDVARAVVFILEQPPHVSIPTVMIKPTGQPM
jgi:NAD(P)-dependent dehydrogenase (short-subunit alcohol dehydrogenase family)